MKHFSSILLLAVFSFSMFSCTKNGKATVHGEVAHHEQLIPNAIIYIKHGTNVFPGANVSDYDMSVNADANAVYTAEGLLKGEHYLYGVGWDPSLMDSVFGGIPIIIQSKKSVLETNVPVTE